VSAALLNKEKHDRTGKTTPPVLVQDIDRIDFKTIRMAGTPCHTYQFGTRKGSKEPVIDLVSGLLMVVDPELPFSPDKFCGGKFPHIHGTDTINL
jgi:hypothetical protein